MERPPSIPQHIWGSFSDEGRAIVGAVIDGLEMSERQVAWIGLPFELGAAATRGGVPSLPRRMITRGRRAASQVLGGDDFV